MNHIMAWSPYVGTHRQFLSGLVMENRLWLISQSNEGFSSSPDIDDRRAIVLMALGNHPPSAGPFAFRLITGLIHRAGNFSSVAQTQAGGIGRDLFQRHKAGDLDQLARFRID